MCGIIGFLDKHGRKDYPVGQTLYGMLQALSCRGPDSAGVAVFGPMPSPLVLQIKCPDSLSPSDAAARIVESLQGTVVIIRKEIIGAYLRLEVENGADTVRLE